MERGSTMDENQDEDNDAVRSSGLNVPPPDLARKPPSPELPLDHLPKSSPPPVPASDVAVNVRIRTGSGSDESPAGGIAPFNSRVVAAIIDVVVMTGLIVGLILLLSGYASKLAWFVGLAYMVTRDSLPFLGGQSVGKKAMRIRAVALDGEPLTGNWQPSLIRGGVLIVPFFALVELWILLDRENKPERGLRLGDEWAKTKVIIEEKTASSETESGNR